MNLVEFAAQRRKAQDEMIAALEPAIGRALDAKQSGSAGWFRIIVDAAKPLFDEIVRDDGGNPTRAHAMWARLALDITHSLVKTEQISEYTHTVIATWLSSSILSAATVEAANQGGHQYELRWITMHDSKVRHTHREAEGQTVHPGHAFRVGTSRLRWPGDTTAPIKEWINCRCTVAPVPVHDIGTAAVDTEPHRKQGAVAMAEQISPPVNDGGVPWHGVLAPEGVWSGDKRKFAPGALSARDLPLPLTYQKASDDGHKGSVTVASIDYLQRDENGLMKAGGRFLSGEPLADEVIGLLAHFGRYGVSVDADSAEFELDEETEGIVFTEGRISSASVVAIPAFQEAFITLGMDPSMMPDDETSEPKVDCDQNPDDPECQEPEGYTGDIEAFAISDKSWDGSASRFTPEEWKRSCILHLDDSLDKASHKLPIKEPNGDLSRAGVHAAASRISQVDAPSDKIAAAKRALRSAYSTLDEDPPESLAAYLETAEALFDEADKEGRIKKVGEREDGAILYEVDGDPDFHPGESEFGRGPGWVTDPKDTKRIHDYWTVPGQPGYEKIGWGVAGDFNRCRVEVGQEIAEKDPATVAKYINQICAQWHHDALGFWPGHAPTEQALETPEGDMAPAVTLVASATAVPPAEWFVDPEFSEPTPITIGEDGHISGHLAAWGVCHVAFEDTCILAPHSTTGYRDFLTGEVLTSAGRVPTGSITIGGKHAPNNMRLRAAAAYYDTTSSAVADVTCGEDEHGIWLNGWVRPWATEQQVYELRAASLSGDWRKHMGNMELIAAHAVNSPGLPVSRVGIKQGEQVSLVASAYAPEPATDSPIGELAEAIAAAIEDRAERRRVIKDLAPIFEED